jgi:hypothetical protein
MLTFSLNGKPDPEPQLGISNEVQYRYRTVPDPECESEIPDVKLISSVPYIRPAICKHKHVGLKLMGSLFPSLSFQDFSVCVLSSQPQPISLLSYVLLFHTRPLPVIQGLIASLPPPVLFAALCAQ